jgi:hypothetical protein
LAYGFLAFVLVVMHAVILFEISHWGMSNCDQRTGGKGGGHVHGNSGPYRGDFQTMLYDKPWYRPGYYVGVLLACLYVDMRDPVTKALKRFSPSMLVLWWTVLTVLFVYSSIGEVLFSSTKIEYGNQTYYHDDGRPPSHYMGSKTECAWSPTWDLIRESTVHSRHFYRGFHSPQPIYC